MSNTRPRCAVVLFAMLCCFAAMNVAAATVGKHLATYRNGTSDPERIVTLRRDFADLDRTIAGLQIRAESCAGATSPAAAASSRFDPRADIDWMHANLVELESRLVLEPRLLSPFAAKVDDASFEDLLFSAAEFRRRILDPDSSIDVRARAFVGLSRLEHEDVFFDEAIIDAWIRDAALVPDDHLLGYLFDVFEWADAPDTVVGVYLEALRHHEVDAIRKAAVVALGKVAFGRPDLQRALRHAGAVDRSKVVRDESASVLRKLRSRVR